MRLCFLFQVDVDECEDLAIKYDISSMPTFIFIKNGEQIKSFTGANNEKLEALIKELLWISQINLHISSSALLYVTIFFLILTFRTI